MIEHPGSLDNSGDANSKAKVAHFSASSTAGVPTASLTVQATFVDSIEVEDSSTLKYLRLRNGDFSSRKSVFLVTDGQRRESL